MKVPMVDMLAGYPPIKDEIETAVKNVFNKANFILGEEVSKFEKDFAAHNGTKYAVGVANGTDALRMAFLASGIKAGDEIITSPFTFIATTETISQVGAIPVFADIDPVTYNLDPKSVEKKITKKTKAVICDKWRSVDLDMPEDWVFWQGTISRNAATWVFRWLQSALCIRKVISVRESVLTAGRKLSMKPWTGT